MKCINCGTDNKLKERTVNRGRCLRCNHKFAFEPREMTGVTITDPMFAKAIADISVNDTLFFTPKQLFYLLDKRLRPKIYDEFYTIPGYLFINIVSGIFALLWTAALFPEGSLAFMLVMFVINGLLIAGTFTASRSSKYPYKQRQKFAKNLQIWGGRVLVLGIIVTLLSSYFPLFLASSAIGLLSIYLGTRKIDKKFANSQEFTLDLNQFQGWLNTWREINSMTKLLPPPRALNANTAVSPDVSAYSFDRLVVCDRPEIAQFLIANNFHFENNCAVLSITGYPQNIFDTTMQMLRRNPDLKVYALHDCTPRGIGLVDHLRTSPNWFSDSSAIIIDIGILPRQILAAGDNIFVLSSESSARDAVQLPPAIRQDLSAEELEWLDLGNYVELESFSPQKLIQILNRGIAGSRDLGSDDSSLILLGGTDSSIYVVDSFG
jgi:DNA-directed RNA polymerase subunit RPC12/RpoP